MDHSLLEVLSRGLDSVQRVILGIQECQYPKAQPNLLHLRNSYTESRADVQTPGITSQQRLNQQIFGTPVFASPAVLNSELQ